MIHSFITNSYLSDFYFSILTLSVLLITAGGYIINDIYDIAQKINETKGAKELFFENSSKKVYEEIIKNEEWINIRNLIEKYLQQWGFRCSGELMFFKKNYIEDPSKLMELLQSYLKHEAQNPRVLIAIKDAERKKAMRSFAWKIIKKRHVFLPLSLVEIGQLYVSARLCKQAISSRERVRYKQAEMYFNFKKILKVIGENAAKNGLIETRDDIFYLKYKEIGELIASSDMFLNTLKTLIKQRKLAFELESKKLFPEHFVSNFGERPEIVYEEVSFEEGATEFYGLAASGGRIKGRVKVLESVLEGEKINKGVQLNAFIISLKFRNNAYTSSIALFQNFLSIKLLSQLIRYLYFVITSINVWHSLAWINLD